MNVGGDAAPDPSQGRLTFHLDVARGRGLRLTEREGRVAAAMPWGLYADMPHRLLELHRAGALTDDLPAYLVPEIWRYRLDDCTVPIEDWRDMFATAAYTHDFNAAPRPGKPIHLFRGATTANREGLSWTLDIDRALYFAQSRQAPAFGTDPDAEAHVWMATVPPERLLAFIGGEEEFVTDARGLPMKRLEPEQLDAHRRAAARRKRRARRPSHRLLSWWSKP